MHDRVTPLLAALVVAVAGCADAPTAPAPSAEGAPAILASKTISNGWRTFPDLVISKCGAPNVVVSGRYHDLFIEHEDASGALHRRVHLNFRLTGESDDGVRYSYSGVQNTGLYFANPPVSDFTELRIRMIAQGREEDFVETFRYHLTINADGEVVHEFSSASEECGHGGGATPA